MKAKKDTARILLIWACVSTFVTLALTAITAVLIGFNLFELSDTLTKELVGYGYSIEEADAEVMSLVFSSAVSVLIELYFGLFYLKALKFRVNSVAFSRKLMSKSIWHFVFGAFIPSLLAMFSATYMGRQFMQTRPVDVKVEETPNVNTEKSEEKVPDYKLNAMSEAIARLKELKDKGAISEEEYYANLNRILEG